MMLLLEVFGPATTFVAAEPLAWACWSARMHVDPKVMLGLLSGAVLGRWSWVHGFIAYTSHLPARVCRGVLRCYAGLVTRGHMYIAHLRVGTEM